MTKYKQNKGDMILSIMLILKVRSIEFAKVPMQWNVPKMKSHGFKQKRNTLKQCLVELEQAKSTEYRGFAKTYPFFWFIDFWSNLVFWR